MRMRQNSGERAIRRVDNTSTLHSKITWIHTFCKIYVTLRIHHAFLWGCNLYALSQTLRYLPVIGPRPLKSRTSEKYGWTNKTSLCNHAWNSKKLSKVHFQTGNMGNTIFKLQICQYYLFAIPVPTHIIKWHNPKVFKICEGIWCSSFYAKGIWCHCKIFPYITLLNFLPFCTPHH